MPCSGTIDTGDTVSEQQPTKRVRWWWNRPVRIAFALLVGLILLAGVPFGWTRMSAGGHLYDERSVTGITDVALVLGAQVSPDGTQPLPFLRGRLDTAADLVRSGRARVILVSGDGMRSDGNETSVMTSYLIDVGISPDRIVADPSGLDTYDSCRRARQVYGVTRALVVTQPYHLARAVALCQTQGIEAVGVRARCDGCNPLNLARNAGRDYFACTKAALDAWRDRDSVVQSPPSDAIARALATYPLGGR
jgi:vancomycin permeability regulator SanA